ncbi:hypothetical protein PISMIDRAFT_671668, partial [Pisolithus microcarpus 441]
LTSSTHVYSRTSSILHPSATVVPSEAFSRTRAHDSEARSQRYDRHSRIKPSETPRSLLVLWQCN